MNYIQQVPAACLFWIVVSQRKNWIVISMRLVGFNSRFHSEIFRFFCITLKWKFLPNWRLGTCRFMFSMLSKTESPGVMNIETDYHRYSHTGSECRVRNINGRAMLPDSSVYEILLLNLIQVFFLLIDMPIVPLTCQNRSCISKLISEWKLYDPVAGLSFLMNSFIGFSDAMSYDKSNLSWVKLL